LGSQIIDNISGGSGGALWGTDNALTFIDSTIEGNSAQGDGGGLRCDGILDVVNTTVSNNTTEDRSGGGIWTSGLAFIDGSTIAGNESFHDGGGV
jgi:predicted outer membrane repeat protein